MIERNNHSSSLRQPKIYVPEAEKIKKPFPRFVIIIILVIVFICAVIYLLFFSPLFKVKSVQINGNPSEEARTYLGSFIGTNIFNLHPAAITDELVVLDPEFGNINVSVGIPNILRAEFVQRQPAIIWQSGGNFYLVDGDEIAYQKVDQKLDNLILVVDNKGVGVTPPQQIASSNFIIFLQNVNAKISDAGLQIDHFEINETTFQVEAITKQGIKIIFDTTRSVTDQIDALKTVYDAHKNDIKQYVDVRVEGKVYYQ